MDSNDAREWIGKQFVGSDGEALGKVGDIYADEETGTPEWLTITTGLFGKNVSFVPMTGARLADDRVVHDQYSVEDIQEAPNVDPDGELTQQEEQALYQHYGMTYDFSESLTGLPSEPRLPDRDQSAGGDQSAESDQEQSIDLVDGQRETTDRETTDRLRLRRIAGVQDGEGSAIR